MAPRSTKREELDAVAMLTEDHERVRKLLRGTARPDEGPAPDGRYAAARRLAVPCRLTSSASTSNIERERLTSSSRRLQE